MMISTLLLAAACGASIQSAPSQEGLQERVPDVNAATLAWSAPGNHIVGEPYRVSLKIHAPKGTTIPGAWLGPDGFSVNGTALGIAVEDVLAGYELDWTLEFDLAPFLNPQLQADDKSITLGVVGSGVTQDVSLLRVAPEGLDFMSIDVSKLDGYGVLLRTTSGDMLLEFWPETAPNHVRNFLDLSYTGFYDGILFHRCIPGFMIQGGDPMTKDPNADPRRFGGGNGPRRIDAEFSERPHVRGVLSAARLGNDVNSATSQFFICHQRAASLDRQYTAYGQLISGQEVIDAIVNSPKDPAFQTRGPSERPLVKQVIESAIVVTLSK